MSYKTDKKFSLEDFSSFDAIDDLIDALDGNVDANDDNGYTPLCFAVLNNIDQQYIIYLSTATSDGDNYAWPPHKCKGAKVDLVCDKGKSPVQYAIMSGNLNAIRVLFGSPISMTKKVRSPYNEDLYENAIKYDSVTHLPIFVEDDKGNETSEYEYETVEVSIAESADINRKYIYEASSMTTADVLNIFAEKLDVSENNMWYYPDKDKWDSETPTALRFDNFGNTPLIAAVRSQCYDSVKLILSRISRENSYNPDGPVNKIFSTRAIGYTNSEDKSADSIANSNHDRGISNMFVAYYEGGEKLKIGFCIITNSTDSLTDFIDRKIEEIDNFNILTWEDAETNLLYNKYPIITIVLSKNSITLLKYIEIYIKNKITPYILESGINKLNIPDMSETSNYNDTSVIEEVNRLISQLIEDDCTAIRDTLSDEDKFADLIKYYIFNCNGNYNSFITYDLWDDNIKDMISYERFKFLDATYGKVSYDEVTTSINTYSSSFINIEDPGHPVAKRVNSLVDQKCYNILNRLNSDGSLALTYNEIEIENSSNNRSYIEAAVTNKQLDSSKLSNWPWCQ